MDNADQRRLKDIESVTSAWIGGYTNSTGAMHEVNKIMSRKYIEASNVQCVNMDNGKTINIGTALLEFRR
ncbi:hypothetical protein [Paenibacillus antarcticus]|uniref:Uncharacterized protein n=1 Tax=Paenibacillus antarcticus TaxID=253703 RepID=A0A168R1N1_9BACL|nr:hypothetical protein [Paenibacillus antarcticus]OAB48472.1 hypothetical protein PBAT_02235 [Paenibacillus antarcticus]